MKLQPLVSVVMPTYNHARYIGEAIESVLNQSYENLELVIIDNYSEDDTEEIVSSYRAGKVKYLKFKNYGSIAASRNYGIKNSGGLYVAFLDSDDVWHSEKLETQIRYLNNHPSVGLVFCDYFIWAASGITTRFKHCDVSRLPNPGFYFECLCTENPIGNSTVVMRRDLVKTHGLLDEDVELRACEDYEYWFRLSQDVQFGFICQPLVLYRVLDSSISRFRLQFARRTLLTFEKVMRKDVDLENRFMSAVRKGRSVWNVGIGYAELLSAKKGWRRCILRALCYDPFNRRAWGILIMGALGPQFAIMLNKWLSKKRNRLFRNVSELNISPGLPWKL